MGIAWVPYYDHADEGWPLTCSAIRARVNRMSIEKIRTALDLTIRDLAILASLEPEVLEAVERGEQEAPERLCRLVKAYADFPHRSKDIAADAKNALKMGHVLIACAIFQNAMSWPEYQTGRWTSQAESNGLDVSMVALPAHGGETE